MLRTQKQETFCLRYFETGNATQAALDAGYSPKWARSQASENLSKPHINQRIDELRKKVEDASVATVLEMQQMLTQVIRGRFADFMTNLTPEKLRSPALKRLRVRESPAGKTTTIELNCPMEAVEKLAKLMGIWKDGSINIDARSIHVGEEGDDPKQALSSLIDRYVTRISEGEVAQQPNSESAEEAAA